MEWFTGWFATAVIDGFFSSVRMLATITVIVFPVLVGLEIIRALGWLDVLTDKIRPFCRRLGIPPELAPPLTAGVTLGLMLSSGVVIQETQARSFDRKTLTLFFIFVGVFHSLFEETVVISAVGGNGLIMVTARFLFGLLAALIYRMWLQREKAGLEDAA